MAIILEAAARILEERGAAAYTTNGIAARAGVSIGSLYQYFPNKDSITRALIRRELAQLEDDLRPVFIDPTAPEALTRFATAAAGFQMRRPRLSRVLEDLERRLLEPDDVIPVRNRIRALLTAVLEERGVAASDALLDDLMTVTRSLTDAAGERGEGDVVGLAKRIEVTLVALVSLALAEPTAEPAR